MTVIFRNLQRPTTIENGIGWVCALMILIAYAANLFGIMEVGSLLYLLFNAIGASGIAYIATKDSDFQAAFLNIVWFIVAIFGIVRYFFF